jgi:hypothetical protein
MIATKKNAAYNRLVEKYKAIDPNANRDIVDQSN